MWRWSSALDVDDSLTIVFSTYVEVIPRNWRWKNYWFSILHVCGGDPDLSACSIIFSSYSPRMWRWSSTTSHEDFKWAVFSTYVEVILKMEAAALSGVGILHVCGGDPVHSLLHFLCSKYSPRMWRWSQLSSSFDLWYTVFSTYVEVILILEKTL